MFSYQTDIFRDFGGLFIGKNNGLEVEEEEGLIDWDDEIGVTREESPRDQFNNKWGWYPVLRKLAGGDFRKIDEIVDLPIYDILLELSFQKEEGQLLESERATEESRQKNLESIRR